MRLVTCLIVTLVILAAPGVVFGDGKVFPSTVSAETNIPDQEALIHWADGVETLVIQTSFTGEGDEFAWVVPTPSQPEVSASTTGLFPTLRALTAPTILHPQRWWAVAVWLVVFVVWGFVRGRLLFVLVVLLVIFLSMGVLLPSAGSARGGGPVAGVSVHKHGVVGNYEVAVLSADDMGSLTNWLGDNNFRVSPDSEAAIKAYVEDGWFFTVAKLVRDESKDEKSATHPLAFRFNAERPVYPLRLTATGSSALEVDLYVFGPQRASAKGFDVAFCDRLTFPELPAKEDWHRSWAGEGVPIFHPELRSRVGSARFVTKLSANLSPADMVQDAMIQWDGEKTYVPTRWTFPGAKVLATNIGLAGLALTVMSVLLLVTKEALQRQANARTTLLAICALLFWMVVGYGVYLLLPKSEAHIVRAASIRWRAMPRYIDSVAEIVREDPELIANLSDPTTWADVLSPRANPADGGPVRLEDSPGNVTMQHTDDGLVITIYGPDGAPLQIDSDFYKED